MMMRILLLGVLLFASPQAWAQETFVPTEAERATISDCIARTASEPELKQMSACIGLVAGPCVEAPDANTFSLVACHRREQAIWDEHLNGCYGEVQDRLKDDTGAASALKVAQRDWIAFRDAKCAYWAKRYEGGTIVSVMTGDCMRVETGRRALEMRAISDDLDH